MIRCLEITSDKLAGGDIEDWLTGRGLPFPPSSNKEQLLELVKPQKPPVKYVVSCNDIIKTGQDGIFVKS